MRGDGAASAATSVINTSSTSTAGASHGVTVRSSSSDCSDARLNLGHLDLPSADVLGGNGILFAALVVLLDLVGSFRFV